MTEDAGTFLTATLASDSTESVSVPTTKSYVTPVWDPRTALPARLKPEQLQRICKYFPRTHSFVKVTSGQVSNDVRQVEEGDNKNRGSSGGTTTMQLGSAATMYSTDQHANVGGTTTGSTHDRRVHPRSAPSGQHLRSKGSSHNGNLHLQQPVRASPKATSAASDPALDMAWSALEQLNQGARESRVKLPAKEGDALNGECPRPATAQLHGRLSPAAAVAAANSLPSDPKVPAPDGFDESPARPFWEEIGGPAALDWSVRSSPFAHPSAGGSAPGGPLAPSHWPLSPAPHDLVDAVARSLLRPQSPDVELRSQQHSPSPQRHGSPPRPDQVAQHRADALWNSLPLPYRTPVMDRESLSYLATAMSDALAAAGAPCHISMPPSLADLAGSLDSTANQAILERIQTWTSVDQVSDELSVWEKVLWELCRQVHVHMAERGNLMFRAVARYSAIMKEALGASEELRDEVLATSSQVQHLTEQLETERTTVANLQRQIKGHQETIEKLNMQLGGASEALTEANWKLRRGRFDVLEEELKRYKFNLDLQMGEALARTTETLKAATTHH